MFEQLRLLVTLEMKVFHKSIYILQDEAMTETVDALVEDGSKFFFWTVSEGPFRTQLDNLRSKSSFFISLK